MENRSADLVPTECTKVITIYNTDDPRHPATLLTVTLDEQNSLPGHCCVLRFLCACTRGQTMTFTVTEKWELFEFQGDSLSPKLLDGAG